jgi:hypothetical protein
MRQRQTSILAGLAQALCMVVIFVALLLTTALAVNGPEAYVAAVKAGAPDIRLSSEVIRWVGAEGMDRVQRAQLMAQEAHHVGSVLVAIMVAAALTGIAIARRKSVGPHMLRGVTGPLLMFYAITLVGSALTINGVWDLVVKQLMDHNGPAAMSAFTGAWDTNRACIAGVIYLAGIMVFSWPSARAEPTAPRKPAGPAAPEASPTPPPTGKTATL